MENKANGFEVCHKTVWAENIKILITGGGGEFVCSCSDYSSKSIVSQFLFYELVQGFVYESVLTKPYYVSKNEKEIPNSSLDNFSMILRIC